MHPIFHSSLLKKHIDDNFITSTDLPPITEDETILIEPKAIMDTCWICRGAKFYEESLVKWRNLAMEDATWESTKEPLKEYPNSNLKDKSPLGGGGNDTFPQHQLRHSQCMLKRNPKYLS